MAAGVWYLTDAEGNLIGGMNDITVRPVKGSNDGGHAEKILLAYWLNSSASTKAISELLLALADGQTAQLHLVIFSQLSPCLDCRIYFDNFMGQLALKLDLAEVADPILAESAPPEPVTAVTLDVFGSAYVPVKPNWWSTSQAVWPGTTNSYGITDYWNNEILWGGQ